jgi:hypothetical protein
METIKRIINKLSPNKYIAKNEKNELERLCNELDEKKNEKLIEGLNEVIKSKKYTNKLKETLEKLMEDLNEEGITQKEVNEILEEAIEEIKEIEDENLEKELDELCERYNKFSESNPAEYVSCGKDKTYRLILPNEKEVKSKNLSKIIIKLKEIKSTEIGENLITPEYYKKYKNELLSYKHNEKELFDINHLINVLGHKSKKDKYKQFKKYVKYYSIKDNQYGGFYLKEYIEREYIKNVIINNRRIGIIKLLELIEEPIIYKIPIEVETMKNLYEIFFDYEPELNYKVDDYYIDLYLKKIKLSIECDENGHKDRKKYDEEEREKYLKEKLECQFYRFDPDDENFKFNNVIKEIIYLIKN